MASKISSFDEKIKLPVTETISRFYQPQQNKKAIRILTVAVYVLCVSLAAIMLSLYYIFIWDPTVKPFISKVANCGKKFDKIIIPEQIAIRLTNYTEISADQFYKNILQHYQQQQSKRKNIKYRKKFILNLYTTSTTTTTKATTTTLSPNKQLSLSINDDNNDKSKILSSITTTNFTIPDDKSTLSSSKNFSKNDDINVDDNNDDDVLIPSEDNSSKMKLQFLSITPKQKILEPYMKSSLEMHKNRKINSDDEDYTDEFGEASGGYIMDIS